jgi:adhesin transport system outer membrane protein
VNAAKRDVRETLRMTWSQRQALAKTVPLAKEYLAKAGEVVEGYELQFVLGRRSVLELLLIRNEIYTSETRLIGLSYDQLLTDYAVAAQMGVLGRYFSPAPEGSDTAPTLAPPNPGYVPPSYPSKNP